MVALIERAGLDPTGGAAVAKRLSLLWLASSTGSKEAACGPCAQREDQKVIFPSKHQVGGLVLLMTTTRSPVPLALLNRPVPPEM
jgi:hypothetical protein